MFTKEYGITVILVCILYDLAINARNLVAGEDGLLSNIFNKVSDSA